jgi:RNA polymerase sigma factor (sigma-70 family)
MSDTATLAMSQDQILAELLAADLESYFDCLMTIYWPLLLRHIQFMIKDETFAVEDIAQQTFVKAYFALRFNYSTEQIGKLKLKGWLWTIASRLCIDHNRTYYRRDIPLSMFRTENGEMWADSLADTRVTTEYLLEISEVFAEIQECIKAHVSKRYQECVILHLCGFHPQEIAEKLIIALSSVRTYICKGIQQLRQAYPYPFPL